MASNHTISGADVLWHGAGYDALTHHFFGRKGVPIAPLVKASLGAPALGEADFLVKAATGTELPDVAAPGETITYTPATDGVSPMDGAVETVTFNGETVWDVRDGATYGRNLVSVVTHGSAVVAMTILLSGYDYTGQAMSELHTITASGTSKTVTGKKAFAYVRSVAITAEADASANTLNIGTGAVLGLPFKLTAIDDVVKASIGGVQELINVASNATVVAADTTSPATTTTGDVRGTITFNTALDGTKTPVVWLHVQSPNSDTGLRGTDQA